MSLPIKWEIEHKAQELWYKGAVNGTWGWHQINEETRERFREAAKASLWCDMMEDDYHD